MLSYFEKQELETLLKKFRDKQYMFISEKNKLRDLLKKTSKSELSQSSTSILSALGGLAVGASLISLLANDEEDSSSSSSSSWDSSSSSSDSDWDSGGGSFDGGGSSDDF